MAEGTSTKLTKSDIVKMKWDKFRAEAAEDKKSAIYGSRTNSRWFYRNVVPRVLVTIMDEFELIQNNIDDGCGLCGEIQRFKHLAAHVDALHKTLTMVQQLEDFKNKEMAPYSE